MHGKKTDGSSNCQKQYSSDFLIVHISCKFPANPICFYVTPIPGAWVCGRIKTFILIPCPVDTAAFLLLVLPSILGFCVLKKTTSESYMDKPLSIAPYPKNNFRATSY